MARPEAPAAGAHAGGAARSRCSFCLARQKTARLKTRVRASRPAVPAPIGPGLSIAPAQHWESTAVYVPVVVAITFGYEGKHGVGTETAGANTVVLMGARLYDSVTGRFLQVDPVPGGSANAYDYVSQDPENANDLNGRLQSAEQDCQNDHGHWVKNNQGPYYGYCYDIPPLANDSVIGHVIHDVGRDLTWSNVGKALFTVGLVTSGFGMVLAAGPAAILTVLGVESGIDIVAAVLVMVGATIMVEGVLVIVLSSNSKAG